MTMLPTSYALPSRILEVSSTPLICGSFSEVYEGTLDGSGVRIKRVHVPGQDVGQEMAKVSPRHRRFPCLLPLIELAGLLRGGHHMETPETPERLTPSGHHCKSTSTRFKVGFRWKSIRIRPTAP